MVRSSLPPVPRQTDGAPKQRRRGRSGHDRDGEARVTGLNTSRTCAVTAGRSGQNTSRTCTAAARSPLASDSDNLDPTNGGARVKGPDPACVAGRPRRRPTEEPRKPGSGPRGSPGYRPRLGASRRLGGESCQVSLEAAGPPRRPGRGPEGWTA